MSVAQPSPEELATALHAWLRPRVPLRDRAARAWGVGSDSVTTLATHRGDEEAQEIAAAKAWQAELFDAGFAWVDGPEEYGGGGLGEDHARVVRAVLAQYRCPTTSCFIVNHHIVGPTVLAHGTPEQRSRWVRDIWRGDIICCQLFSEPGAGSDLASLTTRAVRDGDDWVVDGQKLWSSGAHVSDIGEILVRTGDPGDRHRTITALVVDMRAPGVTVRPLRQMNGSEHFNEVFFDQVRVPDGNRLGPVNQGWSVALSTLGSERSLLSEENNGIVDDPVGHLVQLVRHLDPEADSALELLGEAWMRERVLHTTGVRLESDADTAAAPPPSVVKLLMTSNLQFFVAAAERLLGTRMMVDNGDWGTFAWSQLLLGAPAQRIAGGTDEIQRNILAERVLGLPKETRPAPGGKTAP